MKARVLGTATVISFDETAEKALVCEVAIDCDCCGQQTLRFAGHHIPALLRFLAQTLEEHRDLVGETDVQVLERMTYGGRASGRPEDN